MISLRSIARSLPVRIIKRLLMAIVVILAAFDIYLVVNDDWPTISRVVLNAPPYFGATFFLMGVATANVLFPRQLQIGKRRKLRNLGILIIISVAFTIAGWMMTTISEDVHCDDLLNRVESRYFERAPGTFALSAWPFSFCSLSCVNTIKNYSRVNCYGQITSDCKVTAIINTEIKLFLFLIGLICGYFLWPQRLPIM